jgi:hypothetical protein
MFPSPRTVTILKSLIRARLKARGGLRGIRVLALGWKACASEGRLQNTVATLLWYFGKAALSTASVKGRKRGVLKTAIVIDQVSRHETADTDAATVPGRLTSHAACIKVLGLYLYRVAARPFGRMSYDASDESASEERQGMNMNRQLHRSSQARRMGWRDDEGCPRTRKETRHGMEGEYLLKKLSLHSTLTHL